MQLVIKGKNLEISDALRHYVEKKTARLPRFLNDLMTLTVELAVEKTKNAEKRQIAQITANNGGTILRAEVRAADMFAAIDSVVDKLERRITAYKERLYYKERIAAGRAQPAPRPTRQPASEEVIEEEEEAIATGEIVRVKRFPVKPMSPEEAIEQMELLGHDFFVYRDAATDDIRVIYRRYGGGYGLLIPERG